MAKTFVFVAMILAALTGQARAEKEDLSYNALTGRGFELVGVFLMPTDIAKEYSTTATAPTVVVHLRKGAAVGLCYFNLSVWINGDAASLDNQKSCDMRTPPGQADSQYDFLPPVSAKTVGSWRINRQTGEVAFCFFARPQPDTVGEMFCPKAGDNSGDQKEAGPYALLQPQYENEQSIIRVNQRTGRVSLCYTRNEVIACTPASAR